MAEFAHIEWPHATRIDSRTGSPRNLLMPFIAGLQDEALIELIPGCCETRLERGFVGTRDFFEAFNRPRQGSRGGKAESVLAIVSKYMCQPSTTLKEIIWGPTRFRKLSDPIMSMTRAPIINSYL